MLILVKHEKRFITSSFIACKRATAFVRMICLLPEMMGRIKVAPGHRPPILCELSKCSTEFYFN